MEVESKAETPTSLETSPHYGSDNKRQRVRMQILVGMLVSLICGIDILL